MSFWSKLFGKKKKVEPVKEEVKVEPVVEEEPVVEPEPVVESEVVAVEATPTEEPEPVSEPEPKVVEEEPAPKSEVNLDSLKVVELKELAKEKGIPGYSKLKKAELLEALKK